MSKDVVEFDVHCKMNKAGANEFISFLKCLEDVSKAEDAKTVAMYVDANSTFKPEFKTSYNFERRKPIVASEEIKKDIENGRLFENTYKADYIFDVSVSNS